MVTIEDLPKTPTSWDYNESVTKTRQFIYKWKNLTVELATELWIAREILSTQAWNKKSDGQNSPSLPWAQYCKDIGSSKSTVNGWLKRMFAKEEKELPGRTLAIGDTRPNISNGDFRELIKDINENSIDLILTDPPYPEEFLPLWGDLAREAKRVLKPGHFLISYSGQSHLLEVLDFLRGHLNYYWLGMLFHKGRTGQRFEVNMWNRAKPILFFQKPPYTKQEQWIEDVIISEQPDKDIHSWGQNVNPVLKLIEVFSNPGDTVLDPFLGGGTTLEACLKAEPPRKLIGYEKDTEAFDKIKERLQ